MPKKATKKKTPVTTRPAKKVTSPAAKKVKRAAKAAGAGGLRPTRALMTDLAAIVDRHGWRGRVGVMRPGAAAAITCPPGQCPSTFTFRDENGNIVTIPICVPC